VPDLRGLIVDWGGVMTTDLRDCLADFCARDGIDYDAFRSVLRDWLGPAGEMSATGNPAHALERGEVAVQEFERQLAERLSTPDRPVEPSGLMARMFGGFDSDPGMAGVVRRAKRAGFRTALCSNSWGNEYARAGWGELFDAVVISGEVGMRKPERRIYLLTAERLGLRPEQCVFVDDLGPNVRGAVDAGMVGVRHVSAEQTAAELEVLLGVALA
jgi:epoxide hydrolase-like predicted phosphatase